MASYRTEGALSWKGTSLGSQEERRPFGRAQVMAAILEPSRGLPCAVKHLFPVSYPIFPCLRSAAGILLLKATPTVDKADQKLL